MDFEIKKESFVQLRAKGLSFNKIANSLGISKPTAIKWAKELQNELINYKTLSIEELKEESKSSTLNGLESLLKIKSKIEEEISRRDFSELPLEKLLKFNLEIHQRIENDFNTQLIYQREFLDPIGENSLVKF